MMHSLALLLALLLLASAAQAEDKRSLQNLLDSKGSFERLMGKALEAGNWETTSGEAVAMISTLAEKTAAYLDETGRISEIAENQPDRMASPLASAITLGLAEVVDVYLRYPEVRARLNEPLQFQDKNGRRIWAHAWALAATAPIQSISFCGGNTGLVFFFYGSIAPYLEAQPGETPYRRVLAALEAAGAKPQPEEARTIWRLLCGGDDRPGDDKWSDTARKSNYEAAVIPGSRERVLKAPQMLDAIEAELRTLQSMRAEGKVPVVVFPELSD
jgi:hypothetical protein